MLSADFPCEDSSEIIGLFQEGETEREYDGRATGPPLLSHRFMECRKHNHFTENLKALPSIL
jgi:hypothetical protein